MILSCWELPWQDRNWTLAFIMTDTSGHHFGHTMLAAGLLPLGEMINLICPNENMMAFLFNSYAVVCLFICFIFTTQGL